jgi:transcriptional regulator with XRE-family HTH domain
LYGFLISGEMALPTGNLLRAARALAGLKAGQLADLAGVDASTISRLESAGTGRVRGQAQTVDDVTRALKAKGVEIFETGVRLIEKPTRHG